MRSLLVGDDAMALLIVNDNFASDRVGTVVRPLEKARIQVRPPSWLRCGDVFELTPEGTRDVKRQADRGGLTLDLGTVRLTRFLLISRTADLRHDVQKHYEACFAANVKALLSEAAGE